MTLEESVPAGHVTCSECGGPAVWRGVSFHASKKDSVAHVYYSCATCGKHEPSWFEWGRYTYRTITKFYWYKIK